MFCDSTCESLAHKKDTDKAVAAKKAQAAKNKVGRKAGNVD